MEGEEEEEQEESEDDDLDDTTGDPNKKGRGGSFNMQEDELLCDAWLATNIDLIHGMEQKGTTFGRNIHICLHEHKHFVPYSDVIIRNREWKSLNHRLYAIQEVVSKYCGHLKHLIAWWLTGEQITKQVS